MRLWSVHPRYLDASGLTACWREGLLARKVLRGETVGYRNHPQLTRFKSSASPVDVVDAYLGAVCDEAERRGYHFDRSKISLQVISEPVLTVTRGQLEYEFNHLLEKLQNRMPSLYLSFKDEKNILPHPLFRIVEGEREDWEKIRTFASRNNDDI